MTKVILASVIMASVTIMASVIYGKCFLWQTGALKITLILIAQMPSSTMSAQLPNTMFTHQDIQW